MRYVPSGYLREGMTVAKTLYGRNHERLLVRGVVLTRKLIKTVRRLKIPGLFIEDDISRDIENIGIISDELRLKTIDGLKNVFQSATGGRVLPPTSLNIVRAHIEGIIDELLENKNVMINMFDLKCFDDYTYSHCVNAAILSVIIGMTMNFDRETLSRLAMSAVLHDIGKMFVDKAILNKPSVLTEEEFAQMRQHSILGYNYARDAFLLSSSCHPGIRDHHEKYDGSGYPDGRSGTDISLFGRIISVADVYDALTSERPYRSAMSPSEAMEYIMGHSGTDFDPNIVNAFLRSVAPYPVGSTVQLSNGCTAIVVENYPNFGLRPRVRVIAEHGEPVEPYDINLSTDFNSLNVIILGAAEIPEEPLEDNGSGHFCDEINKNS